jgi:hypothetical protein
MAPKNDKNTIDAQVKISLLVLLDIRKSSSSSQIKETSLLAPRSSQLEEQFPCWNLS